MLGKITDYILFNRIKQKLEKYDIKIVTLFQDVFVFSLYNGGTNIPLMEKFVKELQAQPMIFSVQPTFITGSLVITYDTSYITSIQELDSWFRVLDQVYLVK